MHRVHIDTDLGLGNDDFHAVVLALLSPEVELCGLSVCAGNLTMMQSARNALSILSLLGASQIPVHPGEPLPLRRTYGPTEAVLHGDWGEDRAPVWPFGTAVPRPLGPPAVEVLGRALAVGDPLPVCIGPLTALALALPAAEAALPPGGASCICMGGAFDVVDDGSGNCPNGAEFNFWVDPEAAAAVTASGLPLTVLPWNLGRRLVFGAADLDGLAARPDALGAFYAMVARTFAAAGARPELQGCDLLTVAYLLWPELFGTRPGHVVVAGNSDRTDGGVSEFHDDPAGPHLLVHDMDGGEVRRRALTVLREAPLP